MNSTGIDTLVALGEGITPGPWVQEHRETKVSGGMYSTEIFTPDDGTGHGVIATLSWYPKPMDERGAIGTYREANARAIAAVPHLIAALTTLRKQRDELRDRQRFYGDVVDFAAEHCEPEEAIVFLGDVQADIDGDRLNAWHGFAAYRSRQAKGEGQ